MAVVLNGRAMVSAASCRKPLVFDVILVTEPQNLLILKIIVAEFKGTRSVGLRPATAP